MPTGPSRPRIPMQPVAEQPSPPPRPSSVALESVRERERVEASKRKGYMSTMATRQGGLGVLNIEKTRAFGT